MHEVYRTDGKELGSLSVNGVAREREKGTLRIAEKWDGGGEDGIGRAEGSERVKRFGRKIVRAGASA